MMPRFVSRTFAYGSLCSGIEAATTAWHPLGWTPEFFSEIEPFPSAVLAHHWPDVPNLGDMTKHKEWNLNAKIDLLVGGTPCQAFSVAGLRNGLADARGNLTLTFIDIADQFDPDWIVWENVPGVLSSKDNAFGCFLGGLAGEDDALLPPGGKWANAGCVFGPKRAIAWRILDAQYFGVAQRRRRVFVVASPRHRAGPCAVLFERDGVRRDSAPSREKGEGVTGTLAARTRGGGGLGTDFDCAGGVIGVQASQSGVRMNDAIGTLDANYGSRRLNGVMVGLPEVADTLRSGSNSPKAHGKVNGTDRVTLIPVGTDTYNGAITGDVACTMGTQSGDGVSSGPTVMVPTFWNGEQVTQTLDAVLAKGQTMPEKNRFPAVLVPGPTHSLRGEGFDASEDGTGRGTPLVPVAFAQNTRDEVRLMNGDGSIVGALAAQPGMKQTCYVAYNDAAGTLKSCGGKSGTPNGAEEATRLVGVPAITGPMTANGGTGKKHGYGMGQQDWENGFCLPTPAMQVRRLLPEECEKLQGFLPGHTLIPWRKKPASECPDGPRYKAIGNSMAVPVMAWIGSRIKLSEEGKL